MVKSKKARLVGYIARIKEILFGNSSKKTTFKENWMLMGLKMILAN
jgi:hypothetical protein